MSDIVGYKKGGGGGHMPVEAPDSARSAAMARVLDALSEGEIEGPVAGLQSVFLDGTPLQNADGSLNFPGASVEFRPGSQDQAHIAGFPSVENEIAIGSELRSDTPFVRAFSNVELSAVRIRLSTPQFQKVDKQTGDVNGYRVDYRIELATDGGAFQLMLSAAFDFKVSSKYERSHRIDLPPAAHGWTLRVLRITENAHSATVADTMTVESVAEIIDAKLRYPNTALAGVTVPAEQFQRVPTRSYHMRGRRVRVPSNYDTQSRTYTGVWDGTFKVGYTNNPAWIFLDLVTHPRYGMGHRVTVAQLDRYELYRIAQYCDELVPDGKGGHEPRMTCNVYLQTREDAYKVLKDLSGVFRAMVCWSGSRIDAIADMPADPVYTYTAGNVIGGKFVRQGTDRKTRYTVALVSWCNPANHFKQEVEVVEDRPGVARYGIRQTEITAFGCTSQGQAQRVGRLALLSSRMETQEVAFYVGLDGVYSRPGQIIRIADAELAGRPISGRIRAVDGRAITVDRDPVVKPTDRLIINLPSGRNETRIVSAVEGRRITVSSDWSARPEPEAVWAVESDDLAIPTFRVVSVAEAAGQQATQIDIRAVQHEPGKFDNVESGTRIDDRPTSVIPPSVQPVPEHVRLSTYSRIDQGFAQTTMVVAWDAADGAVQYEVQWRKNNGDWVLAGRTGVASIEVPGIYAGLYLARVVAINALGVVSLPAYSEAIELQGKTTPPPEVTFLRTSGLVFGIGIEWGFPAGALDVQHTEIWSGKTPDRNQAQKLGDFAYPQHRYELMDLRAGATLYFWARLVDRSGNVGLWHPAGAGVQGQASADADPFLDYLTGEIGKDQLTKDFQSKIDGMEELSVDTHDELRKLVDTVGDVKSEVERVDGVVAEFKPEWAGASDEYAGDDTKLAGTWTQYSALTDQISAVARRVDTVASLSGNAAAQIRVEQMTRADQQQALATRIDTTDASIGEVQAEIKEERTARVDQQSALGRRIDTTQAAIGEAQAAVRQERIARVDQQDALGKRIDTTQAKLGDVQAAVQQNSEAVADIDGRMKAYYNLKVQLDPGTGQYYVAGMTIGIDNSSGSPQSQILFQADRFALLSVVNGKTYSPFIVENGQMFISQAFIGEGWITSAMVGDLQSPNYVPGWQGWHLGKNGVFENNGTGPGGSRMRMSNDGIRMYDANGTLRIEMVL